MVVLFCSGKNKACNAITDEKCNKFGPKLHQINADVDESSAVTKDELTTESLIGNFQ